LIFEYVFALAQQHVYILKLIACLILEERGACGAEINLEIALSGKLFHGTGHAKGKSGANKCSLPHVDVFTYASVCVSEEW